MLKQSYSLNFYLGLFYLVCFGFPVLDYFCYCAYLGYFCCCAYLDYFCCLGYLGLFYLGFFPYFPFWLFWVCLSTFGSPASVLICPSALSLFYGFYAFRSYFGWLLLTWFLFWFWLFPFLWTLYVINVLIVLSLTSLHSKLLLKYFIILSYF